MVTKTRYEERRVKCEKEADFFLLLLTHVSQPRNIRMYITRRPSQRRARTGSQTMNQQLNRATAKPTGPGASMSRLRWAVGADARLLPLRSLQLLHLRIV